MNNEEKEKFVLKKINYIKINKNIEFEKILNSL